MTKKVYITIYKDKVETSGESGVYHTYFIKAFKFNERAAQEVPAIPVRLLDELYNLQDLDYEFVFRYGREA